MILKYCEFQQTWNKNENHDTQNSVRQENVYIL